MNRSSKNKATILFAFPLLLLALSRQPADSQVATDPDPDEPKAVLAVVQAFFDTMTSKDVEGATRTHVEPGSSRPRRHRNGLDALRLLDRQ